MSERYAELATRIQTVDKLGSVVGALRGIAAAHAQQGRSRLAGVRNYADTVALAIAQALALPSIEGDGADSRRSATTLLLLFCAEQGFAGAFSESIFDAVGDALPGKRLMVIGRRGVGVAAARGLDVEWTTPMIAHADAAAALADRIATEIYRRMGSGGPGRAEIVYMRPHSGSAATVERRSLLPLDLRRFGRSLQKSPPIVQLPRAVLLQRLAAEYLRAELAEAILHSFTAENSARMASMSAARDNISRTLDGLTREARIARQDQITAELIELASGTEASNQIGSTSPAAVSSAPTVIE
jgi:F-type H+-transporting ATPase subunit gamma